MAITLDGSNLTTSGVINSGTAITASGTSVDFTIPIGAKRITVMFDGVSLSGTDNYLIQLGTSGGLVSSGYVSTSMVINSTGPATGSSNSTSGFIISSGVAADLVSGILTITNITSNTWISSHTGRRATTVAMYGAGTVALGGALTQLSVTRTGTNTFDAGTINILYE